MLDSLYEDIGGKIKNWAKWIFIVEAIAAIIYGIALIADDAAVIGFVVLICGPLVAWVGSWILYAFGQLVEDVHTMRNKEVPPVEYKTTSTILPPPKDIFAKNKTEDGDNKVKRCPYCGDIVKRGRCEMCGKEV